MITSSPLCKPIASRARCAAAVQELAETEYLEPMKELNSFSNFIDLGPVVHHPDRMVSTTSLISSSVT